MANKYDKILGEYREADSVDLSGYVPTTRELTINGVAYDLSADRSWTVAATPGGSDTQVQFNDGGAFGGDAGFVWNKTDNVLTLISGDNTSGAIPFGIKEPTNTTNFFQVSNFNNGGNSVSGRFQLHSPTSAENLAMISLYSTLDAANAGLLLIGINGDSGGDNGSGVTGPNAFIRFGQNGTGVQPDNLYIYNDTSIIARFTSAGNTFFVNPTSNSNYDLDLDTVSGTPYGSRILFRGGGTLYGQVGNSGPITGTGGHMAIRTDSSADLILLTNGNTERMRFSHTTQTALLTSQNSSLKGLVIKGAASQSASWLELQTSTGAIVDYFYPDAIVFNENGGARYFRVEGDTKSDLFFIDGPNDTVMFNATSATVSGVNFATYSNLYFKNFGDKSFITTSSDTGSGGFMIADLTQSANNRVWATQVISGSFYINTYNDSFAGGFTPFIMSRSGGSGLIINEQGSDYDTRIEGDTDANLLFVDAGADVVNIGTATSAGGKLNVEGNIYPATDNTYYLGKNDDDSPLAWKGVILKDTTNGKYYRVEVISGVITATDLTD